MSARGKDRPGSGRGERSAMSELGGIARHLIDNARQIELAGDALAPHVDLGQARSGIHLGPKLPLLLGMEPLEGGQVGIDSGAVAAPSRSGRVGPKVKAASRGGSKVSGIRPTKVTATTRSHDAVHAHVAEAITAETGDPLRPGRAHGHGGQPVGLLFARPLLDLLAAGLLDLFHLLHERSGGLLVVVDHEAVGQVEEVAGVALDDPAHLGGAEGRGGRSGLALAAVLPPSAEGRQAELDGILVGVGAEPRA
mmetsp:Transcript_13574/g.32228  ORF Transcript_13574/g.32228 Transcript_13574/m.32228 type:complete len:252 (-) Transcript_13574:586-1341(-)